jgi:hypothetical protein
VYRPILPARCSCGSVVVVELINTKDRENERERVLGPGDEDQNIYYGGCSVTSHTHPQAGPLLFNSPVRGVVLRAFFAMRLLPSLRSSTLLCLEEDPCSGRTAGWTLMQLQPQTVSLPRVHDLHILTLAHTTWSLPTSRPPASCFTWLCSIWYAGVTNLSHVLLALDSRVHLLLEGISRERVTTLAAGRDVGLGF